LSWNGSEHFWNITFTRSPNDWEEESILDLLSLLTDSNVNVHPDVEDQIVWSLDSRGIFSVKSVCEKKLVSISTDFPAKEIWKLKASTKACFLAWQLLRARCPRRSCLKKETLF